MTDRVKGFTVTLRQDTREDDFEAILHAVRMIKGVTFITPSLLTHEDHMIRARLETEMREKLYTFIKNELP